VPVGCDRIRLTASWGERTSQGALSVVTTRSALAYVSHSAASAPRDQHLARRDGQVQTEARKRVV